MRKTRVEYPSGRELLAAYWGFLASGGLVLSGEGGGEPAMSAVSTSGTSPGAPAHVELTAAAGPAQPSAPGSSAPTPPSGAAYDEGEAVLIDVRIASLRREFRLAGRLRRRFDGRRLIAFDAGQPQDLLLNAAFADGQGVPERRHRRIPVRWPVRFRSGDAAGEGTILDVSRGGCLLATDAPLLPGTRLHLDGARRSAEPAIDLSVDLSIDLSIEGRVRWCRSGSRPLAGVEFSALRDDLVAGIDGSPH